jgi:hypothetical protein
VLDEGGRLVLTEGQLVALEKPKAEKEAHGEFESEHPGYAAPRLGRVYQQTFIDTYAKVGFAKLYDRKTPITAAVRRVAPTGTALNQD